MCLFRLLCLEIGTEAWGRTCVSLGLTVQIPVATFSRALKTQDFRQVYRVLDKPWSPAQQGIKLSQGTQPSPGCHDNIPILPIEARVFLLDALFTWCPPGNYNFFYWNTQLKACWNRNAPSLAGGSCVWICVRTMHNSFLSLNLLARPVVSLLGALLFSLNRIERDPMERPKGVKS